MPRRVSALACSAVALVVLSGCGGGSGSSGPNPLDKVVVERLIGGNYELVVIDLNTISTTQVTNNAASDTNADFSDDGTKIVFTSGQSIYKMNADGSAVTQLTSGTDDRSPAWSPDGTKVVFYSYRDGTPQIYLMNADGTGQTRLSNNSAVELDPSFHPAGNKIIYTSRIDGTDDIWTMNLDGSGKTKLFGTSLPENFPRYNANGSKIVFSQEVDPNIVIRTINADGTGSTILDPGYADVPTWGKSGRIAFFKQEGAVSAIYATNRNGTNAVQIASGDNVFWPSMP